MTDEIDLQLERELASQFTDFDPPLPLLGHLPTDRINPLIRQIDYLLTEEHKAGRLLLPKLDQLGSILAFSDYAGNHKTFQSYAFLFSGYQAVDFFKDHMNEFRSEHELSDSEFQFKERGNSAAKFAEEFATKAARLPGLCVVLLVHKEVPSLFMPQPAQLAKELDGAGLPGLRSGIAERLFRVIVPLSYFSVLLRGNSPKLCWQSDRDELFDSEKRIEAANQLWEKAIGVYHEGERFPFDEIGRIVEEIGFRDLLSIVDIAAGVSADALEVPGDDLTRQPLNASLDTSKKPHAHFANVFCGQNTGLRHAFFTVLPAKDEPGPRVHLTKFDRDDIDPEVIQPDPNIDFSKT